MNLYETPRGQCPTSGIYMQTFSNKFKVTYGLKGFSTFYLKL